MEPKFESIRTIIKMKIKSKYAVQSSITDSWKYTHAEIKKKNHSIFRFLAFYYIYGIDLKIHI